MTRHSLLLAALCLMIVTAGAAVDAQTFPDDQPFASFWFPNDLLTWDPANDPDAPYNRGAVPLQSRFRNPAAQVNPLARPDEARVTAVSIMNPSTSNNPSQGSLTFDRYAFNYWQYVELLVFWGGSAGEGLILAPNSEVIDAAHRNGVPVLGTIFLPPNAFGGQLSWVEDLVQRDGDTYPVGDKLIEIANYYGFDGWFLNQETSGADAALALEYRNFLRYLQDNSTLHIQWYDSMIESGPIAWQNQLNSLNDGYFEESGQVSNSMFLNFFWNTQRLANSRTTAMNLGRSPYDVYAGVDVQANGFNTFVLWDSLFPPGQEHRVSLAFFVPTWTLTSAATPEQFYANANRFWVGANRDPADTVTPNAWKGVANYIPARSPVDSVPFVTHFNTGQGNGYYLDGVQLANQPWNNRGLQDVLPTWRWRLETTGTPLVPELTWTDAYEGGTQLEVTGTLDAANTLALYQTSLPLTATSTLQVAFKGISGGSPSHLEVGLAFENGAAITAPSYVAVGDAASSDWNLVDLDLGAFAGQTLAVLSLRFDAPSTVDDYDIRIGRLAVLDAAPAPPAPPTGFYIENQDEIDPQTATLRLRWSHSPDPVTSYQVFRRNGDDSLTHLGGTANNAYFVARLDREGNEERTTVEVIAIGPDGGRSVAATNLFYWQDTGVIFASGFESGDTVDWDIVAGLN